MDIKSKVVDVSSFLLFEATGDSEAGYFDPAMSGIDFHADQEDDAESCSCATTSDFHPSVVRDQFNSFEDKLANVSDDDVDRHHHQHEDDEDGEVVEQKEVNLYKKCRDDQRINGAVVAKEKESSAVSVDSTKTMNEMEKNRLFWEACLAS